MQENSSLKSYLDSLVMGGAPRISEEEIKQLKNLTEIKEIYSDWECNDFGEDYTLYTAIGDDKAIRYLLLNFIRDSSGGWSYNDIHLWHELTKEQYTELLNL